MDCHVIGPLLATMASSFFICFNPYDILDDIYLTPKDNDIIKLSFNSLGLTSEVVYFREFNKHFKVYWKWYS